MAKDMPWQVPSPQQNGRQAERQMAKDRGARLHPMSGAGSEKNDFSTEDAVFEVKNVQKTHTIKGKDLENLFVNAAKQNKEAVYLVHFEDADITMEGKVIRGLSRRAMDR